MQNSHIQKVFRIIEPILDTFAFLAIKYILLCCGYAFRMDPLGSFVFRAIELFVYCRYYFMLRKALFGEKKIKLVVELLFAAAIVIVSTFVTYSLAKSFGYLEIAPILKEVSNA